MSELLNYINNMQMSYSYKPVLLLALIRHDGHITVSEAADFFLAYYAERIRYGLIAEKANSIFSNMKCDRKTVERNIRENPVKALLGSDLFVFTNGALMAKDKLIDKFALSDACYRRLDRYFAQIDEAPPIRCFHAPEEENGFLSNGCLSEFSAAGHRFTSTEQFIAFNKAMLFNDSTTAYSILKTDDAAKIQQLGQNVLNYDARVWDATRQVVAYRGILQKFTQNEYLRDRLLATGNDILAACAAQDKIWGVGLTMQDEHRKNMDFWTGKNLLGNTLMQVRCEINRKESAL